MKLPQIYCDMDGVLADLEKFCLNYFEGPINRKSWRKLPEDVFLKLPLMDDAKILWSYIKNFDPFILTALPRQDKKISERAKKDKILWMKEKFCFPEERVICVFRNQKKDYSKSQVNKKSNLLRIVVLFLFINNKSLTTLSTFSVLSISIFSPFIIPQ